MLLNIKLNSYILIQNKSYWYFIDIISNEWFIFEFEFYITIIAW